MLAGPPDQTCNTKVWHIGILQTVVRRRLLLSAGPVVLVTVIVAAALASSGRSGSSRAGAATPARPAVEELPTRNTRAKAIEPVAGETAASAALPTDAPAAEPARAPRAGRHAAAAGPRIGKPRSTGPTRDAAISDAEVLKGGIALPPIEAPQPVHDIIEAGNSIARTPYLWGGGHGKWLDKGYDCSGSISYALAAGGLLGGPLDSGRLMSWGAPGPGKWVTIYTKPTHVYMVVAGVRFDTSGQRVTGSRWQSTMRPGGGFVERHPPGL
jgi:cell wall-associated NlpC family hydrolase